MTPERWLDVERLYHEALEREPELRGTFLDEACGPTPSCWRKCGPCSAPTDSDSAFLETSMLQEAARQLASHRPAPVVGRRIGRYRSWNSSASAAWARCTAPATRCSSGMLR